MIPLLILRPEPGASATATRARALGLTPMTFPLFSVGPISWKPADPASVDSLLLTSANAIRHGGDAIRLYRHLPVFAVGAATAEAARTAGFETVVEGSGDAAAALRALAEAGHTRPLHLAGDHRTPYPPLPFAVTERVVYEARAIEQTLPADRSVAMLHSPRAAARFHALCRGHGAIDIVAISAAVLDAAGQGWRSVAVAPQPGDEAMLALATMLCDGHPTLHGSR